MKLWFKILRHRVVAGILALCLALLFNAPLARANGYMTFVVLINGELFVAHVVTTFPWVGGHSAEEVLTDAQPWYIQRLRDWGLLNPEDTPHMEAAFAKGSPESFMIPNRGFIVLCPLSDPGKIEGIMSVAYPVQLPGEAMALLPEERRYLPLSAQRETGKPFPEGPLPRFPITVQNVPVPDQLAKMHEPHSFQLSYHNEDVLAGAVGAIKSMATFKPTTPEAKLRAKQIVSQLYHISEFVGMTSLSPIHGDSSSGAGTGPSGEPLRNAVPVRFYGATDVKEVLPHYFNDIGWEHVATVPNPQIPGNQTTIIQLDRPVLVSKGLDYQRGYLPYAEQVNNAIIPINLDDRVDGYSYPRRDWNREIINELLADGTIDEAYAKRLYQLMDVKGQDQLMTALVKILQGLEHKMATNPEFAECWMRNLRQAIQNTPLAPHMPLQEIWKTLPSRQK